VHCRLPFQRRRWRSGQIWLTSGRKTRRSQILLRRSLWVCSYLINLLSITDLLAETTQGDVERELLAEEQVERAQAFEEVGPVHDTTASKFLSIGLDLENQQ
jgi:hypothetical protein